MVGERRTWPRSGLRSWEALAIGLGIVTAFGSLSYRREGVLPWLLAGGSAMLVGGGSAVRRRWRHRERPYGAEHFAADHAWDAAGETRTAWSRFLALDVGEAVPLAFVVGSVLHSRTGVHLLVLGLGVCLGAWRSWRRFGLGDTWLEYLRLPYVPGERCIVRFGVGEGGAAFEWVSFHLVHVLELPHPGLSGLLHRAFVAREIPGRLRSPTLPDPENAVDVEFELPAGAPGTHLSLRLPRYWEVEVRGKTTSGHYHERFLLPVYVPVGEACAAPAAGPGYTPPHAGGGGDVTVPVPADARREDAPTTAPPREGAATL